MAARGKVLVLGGGANGLIAAAYLARAGREVLVVERSETLGGLAVTDEIAPGFHCPATFASVETFAPSIIHELQLERHGLELSEPGGVLVPQADGPGLYLPLGGAAQALRDALPEDAAAFAELDTFLRRAADALAPVLEQPLPALEPSGLGGLMELLRPAWRVRRMGGKTLHELMRLLPMSIKDVLDERLGSDLLKVAIGGGALLGGWLAPRYPGGALNLLLHRCGQTRGALGHPVFAKGGTGALTTALAAAARAAGAEIRTGARVAHITVREGRVAGLVLEGGEELAAGSVLSTADPRTTLLKLITARELDPDFLSRARAIRARGAVGLVHFALAGLPALGGASAAQLRGRVQVAGCLDDIERAFDDAKYGRLPERPYLDVTFPSLNDPGLAPQGKHVLAAWVQFPPFTLREGTWEEGRERLGDTVQAQLGELAPEFDGLVEARRVLTPADLAERFGLDGGCLYHAEPALDQALWMRPLPGWGRHATPIEDLYLGGSGTHGGGGLSGLPGRNAARALLAAE